MLDAGEDRIKVEKDGVESINLLKFAYGGLVIGLSPFSMLSQYLNWFSVKHFYQ